MAVRELNYKQHKYIGDTGDTKPTAATHGTTPGSTYYDRETGILYITYDGTNWVEKDTIVRLETSPTIDIGDVTLLAGTAVVGKVRPVTATGDEVTDDTADAVKSLPVDATGTSIVKSEDAAHTSGDKGIVSMAVRRDAPIAEAGTDGDYAPPHVDRLNRLRISPQSMLGKPYLRAEGKSYAKWEKTPDFGDMRDAPSGWRARLFGGTQSGDDWAGVEIPIDEMPLTKLTLMQILYELEKVESYGIGITLFVHDPDEHDSRAEISLYTGATGGHTPPPSAQGWNYYELVAASTGLFWYGNNCAGSGLTEGLPNIYTLAQFQADALFSTFTIYRIEVFNGWLGTGELDDFWVGSIQINKEPVLLIPSFEELFGQAFDETGKSLAVRKGWLFGDTTLAAGNNGEAKWARGETSPLDQKSATAWLANLYGGVQTGDDWARLNIPVNELPLGELKSALWTYWMANAETFGVNMVIWAHDPTDNSKRIEITQLANIATLEKAQGWNNHELVLTADQFFFYGEGTTGTGLSSGPANLYGVDDFQADALFKNWTLYRITFEYGWEASGTFEDAYIADVKLNGVVIPLEPTPAELISAGKMGRPITATKALAAAAIYDAADVLSENAGAGLGTVWTFSRIARSDGGKGYITKAHAVSETTGITPRLVLYLFTATPACELDDHSANTALLYADLVNYVGRIDFPAMSEHGTGAAEAIATPSTYGNLPLAFKCAAGSDDLIGVLVTLDAFTQTAGNDMNIVLTAEEA